MKSIYLSFILTFTSLSSYALDVYSDQFQSIQSVKIYEVVENESGEKLKLLDDKKVPGQIESLMNAKPSQVDKSKNPRDVIMVTKELIAIGKEIYEIIEKGKPVVSVESEPVSVLPRDLKGQAVDTMYLSNWKMPKAGKFRVEFQNYLGMTPAAFEFMIIYTYGGQYEEKGAYLTGVQIKPTNVEASWGYTLDASFKVQSIMNLGDQNSPIAGAVLMIDYSVKTLLKESRNTKTFFVNGLGKVQAY